VRLFVRLLFQPFCASWNAGNDDRFVSIFLCVLCVFCLNLFVRLEMQATMTVVNGAVWGSIVVGLGVLVLFNFARGG